MISVRIDWIFSEKKRLYIKFQHDNLNKKYVKRFVD